MFRSRLPIAAFFFLLGSCGGGESPEERLRATIAAMEMAAEKRALGDFMVYVGRDYVDSEGRDREAVRRLAAHEILRNQRLFLFSRIQELELSEDGRATAAVLVAMAGQPLESAGDLPGVEADLYRFEVEFRDREGWQVIAAAWRPAQAIEFLRPAPE